ncbi:hypothetical protein BHE74_00020064 [Ensete ventricosum]|nr:hypothetical protein BHE74_00020064 [Ensete ventricosum]
MPLPPFAPPPLSCAGGDAAAFGRYPYWRSLLPAAALAGDSRDRGAAPCGLVAGSRHLRTGLGRLPLAVASWAAGPCGLAVGGSPLLAGQGRSEIIYPCIPDPNGEDEGVQASSSLAVSTRWISAAKLLQSDIATLAQREGRE